MEHQGERVALQERWQKRLARHKVRSHNGKGPSVSRKKDENAVAAAKCFFEQEGRSEWSSVEDRRRRRVAFQDAAKRMLRYLEDSEHVKVNISELKRQLGTPEEEGFSPSRQGMRKAKSSSKLSGRKRMMPAWRDGTLN